MCRLYQMSIHYFIKKILCNNKMSLRANKTLDETIKEVQPPENTPKIETIENNSETTKMKTNNLSMLVNRCYAIDEETYACVSFNLSTRQGLELANTTKDLIKPSEIPNNVTCHKILENKEGTIHSASVCTTDKNNIKTASDQMFTTFIPTILSNI